MKNRCKRFFLLIAVILMLLMTVFTANAALVGDVTGGDNDVTAADARTILRVSVSLETLTDELKLLADADKNGTITAADARLVLRMSVGLEEKLHFYKNEIITAPDCTNPGKGKATCTQCEDVYEYDIPAPGHDFGEPEILTQVTCDTDGLEKYTCRKTDCGFIDERKVPAGHTPDIPAATCTKDQVCTRGNHIMTAKLGHTTDWGTCGNCKVYITTKHAAAAQTLKTKFLEAKTAAETGYAEINKSVGAAAWLRIHTINARPEYVKAKAAYEAALAACGDIPEFAQIKTKLAKNIENLTGIIAQCDVIINGPSDPSSKYVEFITPLDDLNLMNPDSVTDTNKALTKLIVW